MVKNDCSVFYIFNLFLFFWSEMAAFDGDMKRIWEAPVHQLGREFRDWMIKTETAGRLRSQWRWRLKWFLGWWRSHLRIGWWCRPLGRRPSCSPATRTRRRRRWPVSPAPGPGRPNSFASATQKWCRIRTFRSPRSTETPPSRCAARRHWRLGRVGGNDPTISRC